MKNGCRALFQAIALAIILLVFAWMPALAEGEFTTTLSSTYTVSATDVTRVTHDFVVTNTTPSYYIAKYGYQTSLSGITNIAVTNEGEALDSEVVSTDEKTSISFSFPNEVVGEGKARHFSIAYSSPVFATITGKVLEVTIPRTQKSASYTNSTVRVRVPKSFGQPYRIDPDPSTTQDLANWHVYTFTDYAGQGITAVFGEVQRYQLDLTYYLDNPNNYRVITPITLPPDTTYQKIVYTELDPRPESVSPDADGNWLADYLLDATEQKVIHAKAVVELSVNPQPEHITVVPNQSDIQPENYWQSDNPQIQSLAAEYQTPSDIYNAVIDLLDYTTEPLTNDRVRLGAVESLEQPKNAVCQEFTDLFVAMARANDIPARRATGYAFTSQPELRPLSLGADVLHTWPEFYDQAKQHWQPVDPTWGDTTGGVDYYNFFDLNHIVFAYNGKSSEQPPPAGAFKPLDSDTQTVEVTVTDQFPETAAKFNAHFEPGTLWGIKLPGLIRLTVQNETGQARYNTSVTVSAKSQAVEPLWLSNPEFSQVFLPFANDNHALLLTNHQLLPTTDTILVAITTDGEPTQYVSSETPIIIIPTYLTQVEFYFGVGIFCSFCALVAGSLLVFRHKRQSALRRQSQEPQAPPQQLQSN